MVRKGAETKEDLKSFKEEIIHQFHVVSENVIDQVKQVAEGVVTVNQKLDRFREEIKGEVEQRYGVLSHAITSVSEKIEETRQELKETRQELKETRQELKAEIQEVRQELKTEIQEGRQEFSRKLEETQQGLGNEIDKTRNDLRVEIQEARKEILAATKLSYAELDRRLMTLEKEFIELKHRVEKIESRPIS